MSLFWVLRDFAKDIFIPRGEMEQAQACLRKMEELLPNMMDDSGAGEQAYKYLSKLVLPNVDKIREAAELSKTDPTSAYLDVTSLFGKSGEGIDNALHEDFGWIVYRYLKANSNHLSSVQTRALLRDYMLLNNTRPSMLHSMVLNFALNFSKGHPDFNFYKFFCMWGVDNLRCDDYENGYVDDHEIPSLISRICRAIVDSGDDFPVEDFVNRFEIHKDKVIEHLRQAYFWKLMNIHKGNRYNDLWSAFEYYAENFSSLGPSHWHSEILKIAHRFMVDDNAYRFLPFMKIWIGNTSSNLRNEDWIKEKSEDGKEFPSLAIKAAKKCFDCIKEDATKRNDHEALDWLKQLYTQVVKHNAEDDWSARNLATICIWSGVLEEATDIYKRLLLSMGDKFYLWSELSECITNNNDLRIGLLMKAIDLEKNEDFLGDIHLSLAVLWIEENNYLYAQKELDAYAKHRNEKGWKLSNLYLELYAKIDEKSSVKKNIDITKYTCIAEDFVYANYEWHEYVLTEKRVSNGTEYCNFYDGKDLSFSIKTKRFKILKKAKTGNIFRFRCRVVEDSKPKSCTTLRNKSNFATRIVTPLTISESNSPSWSLLLIKYGVVDYINKEKNVMHILTQESRQVFYTYKKSDIQIDSFVKFREYEDKHNEKTITRIVNVELCTKEEAIPYMKSRIVVVDNINERKQLFHVVLGKNLISDIVRFNQTSIRPKVGDFLSISYCIKKDKDGKEHIKFLDIKHSDIEVKGLTSTVKGRLSVKYKDEAWERDDIDIPDFAFVNDLYVHSKILQQYGIKKDCDVVAKVVLSGDNKWKVYALEIIDNQ